MSISLLSIFEELRGMRRGGGIEPPGRYLGAQKLRISASKLITAAINSFTLPRPLHNGLNRAAFFDH